MNLHLSRQADGRYMLTALPPIRAAVRGAGGAEDLYLRAGEPIGIRHLCQGGVRALFGVELKPLESVRVELTGHVVEKG